jgi:putative ABC transport system permease protein
MMNRWLRHAVLALVRVLPLAGRPAACDEMADTIRALADDARATGGGGAERAYLLRELADLLRHGYHARRASSATVHGRGRRVVDDLGDNLRTSFRQWCRRPVATAGLIGTLAVAVAAVTTTFGLATAVLWRPLPFPQAERLVFVWEAAADADGPFRVTSGRFVEWERGTHAFTSMALFGAAGFSLDGPDGSVPVRGVRVSSGYFDTLGMRPLLGRTFDERDGIAGAHRVVALSAATWRGRFGGAADIVGRIVHLSGEPYQVVGVMPDMVTPGWPSNPARVATEPELREFWVPIARSPAFASNTRAHVYGVVARLRPGATRAQADAELRAVISDGPDRHSGLTTPLRDQFVRDVRAPLLVLFAASLAVLLVACANLTALQVSRFEQRRGELVTRVALGAGRARLVGLLLVDAALLAACGGLAGVWLSALALAWIPGQLPASMPFVTNPAVDVTAALFACVVALAMTGALSLWPVLRLSTLSPSPRGTRLPARTRVYWWMVTGQVAVGVALAVTAALLGESLSSLRARAPGFVIDGVVAVDVAVGGRGPASIEQATRLERDVRHATASLPGVRGVALAYDHPLEANWTEVVVLGGELPSDAAADVDAQLRIVSESYFETLGVRVVDGRPFEEREDLDAPAVVLVNEAFAAAHGGRLIGRRLRSTAARAGWGDVAPDEYAIVGVVENERFRGLDLPSAPAVYLSTRQFPLTAATLLVRADADLLPLAASVRGAIRSIEPDAIVGQPRALSAILAEQLVSRRVTADVAGVFALAAVGLAVIGLYGLMAVVVAGRTREVGVRLALGASPAGVARAVLMESLSPSAVGVAAGLALAIAAGRYVEHLLVDVSAGDPRTLAVVALTVLVASGVAAAIPARRAARVDPITALRSDS